MLLQRALRAGSFLGLNVSDITRVATVQFSSSSSACARSNIKIGFSPDEKTIACWHPEPTVPYEHTIPLPRKTEELEEGDTVLKVQHVLEHKRRRRPDGPTDKELMEMFFTGKPHWRLKPRRRYANENPPKDRKSI